MDLVEGFDDFGAAQVFDGCGKGAAIDREVAQNVAQLFHRQLIPEVVEVGRAGRGTALSHFRDGLFHPGLGIHGGGLGGELRCQLPNKFCQASDRLEQGALELSGLVGGAVGSGNSHQTTTW